MLTEVTDWASETLAELKDAGLLLVQILENTPVLVDALPGSLKWDNTVWAYEQRKNNNLCKLYINIEE